MCRIMNHHYCFSGEQLLFLARIGSDVIFDEIFRYADLRGMTAQVRKGGRKMERWPRYESINIAYKEIDCH